MGHRFRVNVEVAESTGEVMAVYFQIREGKSAKVKEFAEGTVLADYNKRGELLGVEMLAPCEVELLDAIAEGEPKTLRRKTRDFFRRAAPRAMLESLAGVP